jgi:hypothetical protein
MKKLILGISMIAALGACKKSEGEGGNGTIKGVIAVKNYNTQQTSLINSYMGAMEDVYIIYGTDDNTIDDKIEASFDGTYEFKYLRPGTYTVFAYSEKYDIPTGATLDEAVKFTVEVKKKSETLVDTIYVKR